MHGGSIFQSSVRVDQAARGGLERLAVLDPLHMRPALALLDAARAVMPDLPHVAAFDTAFHDTLSTAAAGYALPQEWERAGAAWHGAAPIRLSRIERAMEHRACSPLFCELPRKSARRTSRQRLFGYGGSRWKIDRYDDGLHTARWAHDGDAVRRRSISDCCFLRARVWCRHGQAP